MYKKQDVKDLLKAFDDIVWMAIRYANNKHSYAPGMVRDACRVRAKFGDFRLKVDDTLADKDDGIGFPGDNLKDLLEKYK